jgi:hypothetical protein
MLRTIEEQVERAKLAVVRRLEGKGTTERRWLKSAIVPYSDHNNQLLVLALEGTPVRGYIIVNFGNGKVSGYDAWGTKLCGYRGLVVIADNDQSEMF